MKIFYLIVCALILQSCEFVYDMDDFVESNYKSQVVVNGIITPDSVITLELVWNRKVNDTSAVRKVDYFDMELYENNQTIFKGAGKDGKIVTNIHPKEGYNYNIEITVPDYGVVTASTSIPKSSTFDFSYIGEKYSNAGYQSMKYKFFSISNIATAEESRAMWVELIADTVSGHIQNSVGHYYMTNPFCDQINVFSDDTYTDGNNIATRGSEVLHHLFIRLPYKNIANALPLNFSIRSIYDRVDYVHIGDDEFGNPLYDEIKYITPIYLRLITPSDDYDKYYKSSYKQHVSGGNTPIFEEKHYVYTNIVNGLGIFAGYSVSQKTYNADSATENN